MQAMHIGRGIPVHDARNDYRKNNPAVQYQHLMVASHLGRNLLQQVAVLVGNDDSFS
jgi:hypothetical protein